MISSFIDNRVNERDWQRGGGGRGLFIHNLYICYVKVGKLGFCERGFSNLIALKIYIFMRSDLIKTKVMDSFIIRVNEGDRKLPFAGNQATYPYRIYFISIISSVCLCLIVSVIFHYSYVLTRFSDSFTLDSATDLEFISEFIETRHFKAPPIAHAQ